MTAPVGMRPLATPRPVEDAAPRSASEQKLRTVAKEFEALFVNQLLSSMRGTVAMSDLIDNDGEIQYYRQLYDQALADRTAGGIAEMIIRDYMPKVEAGAEAAGEKAADAPAGPPTTPAAPATAPTSGRVLPPVTSSADPVPAARQRREALAAYRRDALAETPASSAQDWRSRAVGMGGAVADTLSRFGGAIEAASRETGVEPELILAVIVQESGGRIAARSEKGARGLMQLMPETAREVGVSDPHDPVDNIRGGARYLARMRERFGDRLDLVLAGYNAGPGAVARAGDRVPAYPETERYVQKVSGLYTRLTP